MRCQIRQIRCGRGSACGSHPSHAINVCTCCSCLDCLRKRTRVLIPRSSPGRPSSRSHPRHIPTPPLHPAARADLSEPHRRGLGQAEAEAPGSSDDGESDSEQDTSGDGVPESESGGGDSDEGAQSSGSEGQEPGAQRPSAKRKAAMAAGGGGGAQAAKKPRLEVEDDFMKLDDMEAFVQQAERAAAGGSDPSGGWPQVPV